MGNIIITGAFGTTGTALVQYLMNNTTDTLCCYDNLYKDGSKDNMKYLMSQYENSDRFRPGVLDITDPEFYSELQFVSKIGVIDGIYNLAAIVETPRFYDSPYMTYRVNCQGAIDLFKWACDHKVDKFVNCSSSEIYGHPQEIPISETTPSYYDSVDTSTRWSYAHGKILTEYVMNQLAESSNNTKVCHLRYANVYGEHDLSPVHVIPYFLNSMINNASSIHVNQDYKNIRRTFLHNDDSTYGTYLAMKNMVSTHSYNIGSAEEITIHDLLMKCLQISSEYGFNWNGNIVNDIYREGDPKRRVLNTTRASLELGFHCSVSLEDGIRRTAKAFIDQKVNL